MKRFGLHATVLAALLVVLGVTSYAVAGGNGNRLRANLTGFEEVPIVATGASGTFRATLDTNANTLSYTLTYANAESNVTQAHIHLGARNTNGGIVLFLCANTPPITPPASIPTPPTCPSPGGTVTGVLEPADIVVVTAQGITAQTPAEWNQLEGLLRRKNTVYANVHSANSPGGEIRGQIRRGGDGD